MSDLALVIGLDAYDNPAWELRAAVRDALRFAAWVTAPGAGRATAEKLTLLLSPHPDRPVTDVAFETATKDRIWQALYDHKTKGAGARRFWFFYAGHGVAPAGGGPDAAPVLVPADVRDLSFYLWQPIDLGLWIREMQVCPPEQHVYFVDACRGIVGNEDVVTATKTLFFDLSKASSGGQARQAVLFATTAGQLANEQGLHGLFGGALIDGLNGAGPELVDDSTMEEHVLTFGGLAAYTKRRIEAQTEEARRSNRTLPTQEPAESLFRVQSTLEITRFKEKPRSPVRVFVSPEEATKDATAGIRGFNEWKATWERQAEKTSPLDVPIVWNLSSRSHRIEIEARGFKNWQMKVDVIGPTELHADLDPLPGPSTVGFGLDRGALESLESLAGVQPRPPDGSDLAAGKLGQLLVRAHDRHARIEVFAADGKRVEAAWEWLDVTLPVGAYRVEVALPTERPIVKSVLVTADDPEVIDVRPDPELTGRLPPSASLINPHEGFSAPSEAFGLATTTHLGSVLAWAASAAQHNPNSSGQKLRALGVGRIVGDPGQCFVRVLVGDALASAPSSKGGPIETLILRMDSKLAQMAPVRALDGFAVQWHTALSHDTSLTLETSELNSTRIPLPLIPDHVWTIVLVREPTQRTEIHRYLDQLEPQWPFDDTIRLVEQNWRALEARAPLHEGEAERLLERNLDPLALAVLGYRLALEERWPEVKTIVERLGPVRLADAHVLAAFVGARDENMELAVRSPSVPAVGEGYRAMEAWLFEHFIKQDMPPPTAPEPFTGGVWTTFDARGQAVVSKAFPVSDPPAWATPLLAAAKATARIEGVTYWPSPFIGTGFLIGPRTLALTDFIADAKPATAAFGEERVAIEAIIDATNDDRHGALARIAPVDQAPLKLRWTLPEVGTRIAVIGHPMITFTPTIVTLAAFATYPVGEKMIMPGVIVATDETKLTYECWTMAGAAGGPIVDLATGEVIGIHHSGRYQGGTRKLGFGVPIPAIASLLQGLGAN